MSYKESLGNVTWKFLHTFAQGFPELLTNRQQFLIKIFFDALSELYPCEECSVHFQKYLKRHPFDVTSARGIRMYLCKFHNSVNNRLNKTIVDCDKFK